MKKHHLSKKSINQLLQDVDGSVAVAAVLHPRNTSTFTTTDSLPVVVSLSGVGVTPQGQADAYKMKNRKDQEPPKIHPSMHPLPLPKWGGRWMEDERFHDIHAILATPPQKKLDTQNVPQLLFIHPPTLLIFGPEFCWLFGNFLKKPRQPTKNNMPSFTFKAVFSQFLFGIS